MSFKAALVIVDLQEDFLPSSGSLAVPQGRSIVPLISSMLSEKYHWDAVIATQDWHPQDHCSFASNHGVAPFTELEFRHPLGLLDDSTKEVVTQKQIVWPDHCVQNSFGSEISKEILSKLSELKNIPTTIVKKGYLSDREYYSCFKDCWKLHKTEIEDYLVKLGITDVFFVGLAYDFCVLNSSLDCSKAGFRTYVIKDCCKSVYPEKTAETDAQYTENNVKIITSSSKELSQLR